MAHFFNIENFVEAIPRVIQVTLQY